MRNKNEDVLVVVCLKPLKKGECKRKSTPVKAKDDPIAGEIILRLILIMIFIC